MTKPASVLLAVLAAVMCIGSATAAAQSNRIQIENAKPGSSDWLLTKVARHDDEIYELGWRRRKGIEAYASHTSLKAGETLNVHVSTFPVNKYAVRIYRMGYYGGAGARLVQSLGPLQGTAEPTPQDGERSLVECKWKVGFSLEIPADWLSGVYIGKLSTLPAPGGQYLDLEMSSESYFIFIVRDDRRADLAVSGLRHDLVVVQPLAPMAIDVRPGNRAVGRIQRQGWIRRRIRPAVCALLERISRRLPPADQRVRRVSHDRVSAGLLAGKGRLRRHLHFQRRHPRGREGAASRESVPVGRPRRVLDPSRCSTTSPGRGMPA